MSSQREDSGPLARLEDVVRTILILAVLVLALGGAAAQALRGERPTLLA